MQKILFIELLHHHECLENPYLDFRDKGYQTKAVLGEFVFNRLRNISEYEKEFIILKQPGRIQFSSLNNFQKIKYVFLQFGEIYKNTREIKKIVQAEKPQNLYINTIESPFLIPFMIYLLRLKIIKIHLVIHNTNRLKVHFLKYFLFDFLIDFLIKKSHKIILLGEYLTFHDKDIQNKVMYINNRISIDTHAKKFKKITFVISGHLDTTTKDIESVLIGFGKFLEKNKDYKSKIQIVLLGQLNNKVESWINKYKLNDIIKTFHHYVGEKDMEYYMSKAHYAIISTYKNSIYGTYKISGAYGDAVAFNLPIILSENYAPGYKDKNVIRFKNKKLDTLLDKLIIN